MREILASQITEKVEQLCIEACLDLPKDVLTAIETAAREESSPIARDVFDQLLENARIAADERVPICQDTGFTIVFVKLGQEVHIAGGDLTEAINQGVRQGYEKGFLRKSIVRHPLDRVNTADNTPAVVHTCIVPGDSFTITVAPKGGGSENMSIAKALAPSAGFEGVKKLVVDTVKAAGSNPCPPIVLGIGLGGTIDKAAILSKYALTRKLGEPSSNPIDADIERKLLIAVNETGVGASGLGGSITALAVHVESYPCHIASLPVAITIQCHAARHKEASL